MALNGSGKISLAGSTAGESIALELSKSATGMISMNDTDVRALAGITSGVIQLDDFYGKSSVSGFIARYYSTNDTVQSNQFAKVLDNGNIIVSYFQLTSITPVQSTNIAMIDGQTGQVIWAKNYDNESPDGTDSRNWRCQATRFCRNDFDPNYFYVGTTYYRRYGGYWNDKPAVLKINKSNGNIVSTSFWTGPYSINVNHDCFTPWYDTSTNKFYAAFGDSADNERVAVLDSSCNFLRSISAPSTSRDMNVVNLKNGHVYIQGNIGGSATSTIRQGFLLKVNTSTEAIVAQYTTPVALTPAASVGLNVQVDSSDNVYMSGTNITSGYTGTSLAKLNSSLSQVWCKRPSDGANINLIAMDNSNNIYCTVASNLVKIDPNGNVLWSRSFTASGITRIPNNVDILNDFMYVSVQDTPYFVAKLPIDGTKTGTYTVDGTTFVYGSTSVSLVDQTLHSGASTSISSNTTNNFGGAITPVATTVNTYLGGLTNV
jgi:hypothetical protein